MSAETCTWKEDLHDGWGTGCGERAFIEEGIPSENKMRFCWYCGKPLEEEPYVDDEEAG
jgi:hypothetical protein